MVRITLASVLAALLAGPAVAGPRPSGEMRHSGRIVEVAPNGSAVVLEEIVTWNGPGPGVVSRSIQLTPRTAITLVERTDEWGDARTSMPGWDRRLVDATSVRPGDFVTVTTDDDRPAAAVALQIVRPVGE